MESLQGRAIVKGIAVGAIYLLKKKSGRIDQKHNYNPQEEWVRVKKALTRTQRHLEILTEEARLYGGNDAAAIFEAHQMILMDEEFSESIHDLILQEEFCAEYAITKSGEKFAEMFAAMDMEYMQARANDIRDITNRLLMNIDEEEVMKIRNSGPIILVAESLNPSDIFRFDKNSVLALVTTAGSPTSHAAILARSMGIPAIIHVEANLDLLENGEMAIVDSDRSLFILKPTEQQLREAKERQRQQDEEQNALRQYIGKKSYAYDGNQILIGANITDSSEVDRVIELGADGIGLFRTEFLFMGRKDFPTEEEQFVAYRQVAEKMRKKPVVIRTMDIGSDKQLDYFHMNTETNPTLGLRGIRVSIRYPELFKVQLRALFRAARYGNLQIMYPLITSRDELHIIRNIIDEATFELEQDKLPYRIPRQGIMIETPAAVMISEELAQMVDFFSIGTNDLTQYALAIDRQNSDLDLLYDKRHEAIMRMIQMTINSAHKYGIKVGICGEMASDPALCERFTMMGVNELSMPCNMILTIRKALDEVWSRFDS